MRILHLLGDLKLPRDPSQEGASGVVKAALEIARAQVRRGHAVWVAAVGRHSWQAEWAGVRLLQCAYAPWAQVRLGARRADFSTHMPYLLLAQRQSFDVVQGHLYSYLRFLRARLRLVHFHSDPYYAPNGLASVALGAQDFALIKRSTAAQVVVSNFVGSQLRRGLGSADTVYVVHNGVDGERFHPDRNRASRQELRARWGVPDDEPLFLFAGAVVPDKGVVELARAFARLSERATAHLALAGSSALWEQNLDTGHPHRAYEDQVRQALAPLVERGRVHILRSQGPAQMPAIYAAADVVVIPSICQEGFPLVALEALASGRPLIASRVGGIPESVTPETGVLLPPGDEAALSQAMLAMAQDPGRRERLGAAALLQARRFSWERCAESLDAIYTRHLRAKGAG